MFFKTKSTPYFRPGVGAVIYNDQNEVLTFKRTDIENTWQFPQGGLDGEELIEAALWRELEEETALCQADFSLVTEYPDWTLYEYPPHIKFKSRRAHCLGQTHRWYFLKIKESIHIDLSQAADNEFSAWKWQDFKMATTEAGKMKQPIYEKLHQFFITSIINDNKGFD